MTEFARVSEGGEEGEEGEGGGEGEPFWVEEGTPDRTSLWFIEGTSFSPEEVINSDILGVASVAGRVLRLINTPPITGPQLFDHFCDKQVDLKKNKEKPTCRSLKIRFQV